MIEKHIETIPNVINTVIDSSTGNIIVCECAPTHTTTDIPVVISPGWGELHDIFHQSQHVLADRSRRSFSFSHPRLGGDVEPNSHYPIPELRKAQSLLDVINFTGADSVDIIAHSEASIYSVIAATLKPEKFRNMVLIAPAGMIGPDTFTALLGRMSNKIALNLIQGAGDLEIVKEALNAQESVTKYLAMNPSLILEVIKNLAKGGAGSTVRKKIIQAQIDGAAYITKNPLRALSEALAISKSIIDGMLSQLRCQGVGIVIIHHADDVAFPMQRIQKIAKTSQVDGILAVTGLHDDVYVHPKIYTATAEEMLSALENKQAR